LELLADNLEHSAYGADRNKAPHMKLAVAQIRELQARNQTMREALELLALAARKPQGNVVTNEWYWKLQATVASVTRAALAEGIERAPRQGSPEAKAAELDIVVEQLLAGLARIKAWADDRGLGEVVIRKAISSECAALSEPAEPEREG
jgi:hypothetical protein